MYLALLYLHSILRWVIILLLLINIFRHFSARRKPFAAPDKKLGLYLLIAAHTTLLIGLYQWFAGGWGLQNIINKGMGNVMKSGPDRFYAIEHPVGMIIAIVLITMGRGIAKKELIDEKKHVRCLVIYILALIVILASIPWPGMENIGRPLWPRS